MCVCMYVKECQTGRSKKKHPMRIALEAVSTLRSSRIRSALTRNVACANKPRENKIPIAGNSGRWLYLPVRTNTLSRTYRTRVVARYPCIMIISHLDALNPAACHRPVPSCTIFFRLARSKLLQSRHRCCRSSLASSFTGTLRCKRSRRCKHGSYRRDLDSRLRTRQFFVRLMRIETSREFVLRKKQLGQVGHWKLDASKFFMRLLFTLLPSCYSYSYTNVCVNFYLIYDVSNVILLIFPTTLYSVMRTEF